MGDYFKYFVSYFILGMVFLIFFGIKYYDLLDKSEPSKSYKEKGTKNYKIYKKYIKNLTFSFILFIVVGFFLMLILTVLAHPELKES